MDAIQALKFIDSLLMQLKLTRSEHGQVTEAINIISKSIAKPIYLDKLSEK